MGQGKKEGGREGRKRKGGRGREAGQAGQKKKEGSKGRQEGRKAVRQEGRKAGRQEGCRRCASPPTSSVTCFLTLVPDRPQAWEVEQGPHADHH